ncbi:MAG TPA: PP2C family protein-serine/threonine phosphatase [Streptosporangiaceae bacterium]
MTDDAGAPVSPIGSAQVGSAPVGSAPVRPAPRGSASGGSAPRGELGLLLGAGFDLPEIARQVLNATVPGFADATSVFVLERLFRGEPAARPVGGVVLARRLGSGFSSTRQQSSDTAFPPGEVIAFAEDSPLGRCVHSGLPVVYEQLDGATLDQVRSDGKTMLARYTSFLALPMIVHDTVIGFIGLAREPGKLAFASSDATAAATLVARAGTTIVGALTLLKQRTIADALQRGLLAAEPPAPSRLEMAGRCLPADRQLIGGDWYDVIPLPRDRTGLVVGDVMGHGPEAAAIMAQLRAAAHALADLDLPPAELLERLNRLAATLPNLVLATCAYAVIDPLSRECAIAGAGHLPPVLAFPDGTTRILDLPAGESLGLGTEIYREAAVALPPGAVLALFTDGLVESRTRAFDQGILALQTVLSTSCEDLEATCDALIGTLADHYEDDVTVVLARIPAAPRLTPFTTNVRGASSIPSVAPVADGMPLRSRVTREKGCPESAPASLCPGWLRVWSRCIWVSC